MADILQSAGSRLFSGDAQSIAEINDKLVKIALKKREEE